MDKRDELAAKAEELRSEIEALADADELTEDQEARLDAALTEHDEVRAELAKAEERAAKVEAVRAAAENPRAVISGDGAKGAPNVNVRAATRNVHDLSDLRFCTDEREFRSQAIDRAEQFINESRGFTDDAHREEALSKLRGDTDGSRAIHMLRFGSPEYREGFEEFMRFPQFGPTPQMRAAMSTTAANGGYTVPTPLDPSIIIANAGSANPIRRLASVKTITETTWKGVSTAGVTAEWIAEATEVADASPTWTQPSITPAKADAYIQGSMEVLADSAVTGELVGLLADAKDRLEATAFWTGSGSGQPKGVVVAVSGGGYTVTGSSGAVGAADLTAADIYALDDNLSYRYKANASFVAHRAIYNKVRQLGTSNTYHAFWSSFGGGVPPELIGYPCYEASAMDSTIVSGSTDFAIVLGDFRQGYAVVDRMGMEVMYNPMVLGSNRRPSGEAAWVAFWRVGGDCVNSSAFRLLHL